MRRLSAPFALVLLLVGCTQEPTLYVDVRSDLIPRLEFSSLILHLDGERVGDHVASSDLDYVGGQRLAVLRGVSPGTHRLRVSVFDEAALVLVQEVAYTMGGNDSVATVRLTRDCARLGCDRLGGGLACVAGQCVPLACGVEEESSEESECPSAGCVADADCSPANACAVGVCHQGLCYFADGGECGDGLLCDPESGCTPRPHDPESCGDPSHPFDPSNLSTELVAELRSLEALGPLELPSTGRVRWVLDTDDGSIRAEDPSAVLEPEERRPAAGGLDSESGVFFRIASAEGTASGYGVFAIASLNIPEGAELVGVGPRPLILWVEESAEIAGLLSVAAIDAAGQPGAGGGRGTGFVGQGPGAGGYTADANDGGGGASYGGAGGHSGLVRGATEVTPAGALYGNPELVPLLAGSGGSGGGWGDFSRGGHGGGALQVTCGQRLWVRTSGVVDASGGGGLVAGRTEGGGGGSGGAVLLEAPRIDINGFVGANGGGGAGSSAFAGSAGTSFPAEHGRATRAPAAGSLGEVSRGGDGSDSLGVAQDGEPGVVSGAGGGGAGRILIRTRSDLADLGPGLSPALSSESVNVGDLACGP